MARSAAARFAKLTAKYGPHAIAAARIGGPVAKQAVLTQQRRLQGRRHAFDKAGTVEDGSVLRVRDGQEVVWVVFAADDPVAVYPEVTTPVSDLVARADLSKRVSPEQHEAARARRRARQAAGRAAARVRRRRGGASD
jgi:hypothetical protein